MEAGNRKTVFRKGCCVLILLGKSHIFVNHTAWQWLGRRGLTTTVLCRAAAEDGVGSLRRNCAQLQAVAGIADTGGVVCQAGCRMTTTLSAGLTA